MLKVMMWKSSEAKSGTIFAVFRAGNSVTLPAITPNGHWVDFYQVDENRFPHTAESKASLENPGYWLMGGTVESFEIAKGDPPK